MQQIHNQSATNFAECCMPPDCMVFNIRRADSTRDRLAQLSALASSRWWEYIHSLRWRLRHIVAWMVYRLPTYAVALLTKQTGHCSLRSAASHAGVCLCLGQDYFQSAIARFRSQALTSGLKLHLTSRQHPHYQHSDLGLKLTCLGFFPALAIWQCFIQFYFARRVLASAWANLCK